MNPLTTADATPLQQVTMVLVTDQFQCHRLISAGQQLAGSGTRLEVINVASSGAERNHEALEYLYQVSKDSGAIMTIHYSENPTKFLAGFIDDAMPAQIVTGIPQQTGSFLHKIWTRFETIAFYTVDMDGQLHAVTLKDRVIA